MYVSRNIASVVRLIAIVAAATTLSACDVVVTSLDAKGKAQDQWTRTYTFAPGGEVEIVNANGGIEVVGTAGGSGVEVVADRTARGMTDEDARKILAQIQIAEEVSGTHVRLETKAPTGEGRRVEVKYRLKVPASTNVRLTNTNGTVDITAVEGTVRAETTNGSVKGRELAGSVEASTTNGSVRLEVSRVATGGIHAESVNGSVDLTLPATSKADVEARCLNGRISLDGLKLDGPERTRRRVEGRLNGGGPNVTAVTTNGGIRITGK